MLEARVVSEHSLRDERGPRLLRYLLARGAGEFSIRVMAMEDTQAPYADRFEDELAPYVLPIAGRRVVTGQLAPGSMRPVRLWSFTEAALARLLSFLDTGLLHSPPGPDGWLEDLTIYRQAELVLGLVSHEKAGVLRLTPDEHAEVAAMDIPSEVAAEWIGY
jgi:hypothetical protein